jgi:hypothetical protein
MHTNFAACVAAVSGQSVDPILHREPPLFLNDLGNAMVNFILNIKKGLAYLCLDLQEYTVQYKGIISKTLS